MQTVAENLNMSSCRDHDTESCLTTDACLDDLSLLSSPGERDCDEVLEGDSPTWKTASFSDDRARTVPQTEEFTAGEIHTQAAFSMPMVFVGWVPVAVPVAGASDVYLNGEAGQLIATATTCESAATELRAAAAAQRMHDGASTVEYSTVDQTPQLAFMLHEGIPDACDHTSLSHGVDMCAEHTTANSDGRTTVMLRNIPNNYTRAKLIAIFVKMGFVAKVDFVYLPMDFHRHANLGYAFVNLVNYEEALQFQSCFDGFCEWGMASEKVAQVGWGEPLQGLAAHIQRYRNSPVMHPGVPEEYKPMLFLHGQFVPFPKPTRRLRAPRLSRAITHKSTVIGHGAMGS